MPASHGNLAAGGGEGGGGALWAFGPNLRSKAAAVVVLRQLLETWLHGPRAGSKLLEKGFSVLSGWPRGG